MPFTTWYNVELCVVIMLTGIMCFHCRSVSICDLVELVVLQVSRNQMVKLLLDSQTKASSEVHGVWLESELDRHATGWLQLRLRMIPVSAFVVIFILNVMFDIKTKHFN